MERPNWYTSIRHIELSEIQISKVIDRGSYGTVKIAKWGQKDVAVKVFETASEKEAFQTEIEAMTGVRHVNIIEFFGICVSTQNFIIMELANQGSLYNLLHKRMDVAYSTSHMLVWWLEIAEAIAYLHNHKPKPIIHRDLKSSNLLLKDDHIKVCDFGTACDIHTLMSNAKGTVAWMAPEVITSTTYNEKCDVYSCGICMWELLMRKVPFKGRTSFQIMNYVTASKGRPELPPSVPNSIRVILQQCWQPEPDKRPSMTDISKLLERLWNLYSTPFPQPTQRPSTPQETAPGPSSQSSPPRFPIAPPSCTPSPTIPTPSPSPSERYQEPSIQPSATLVLSSNQESCDIYAEHLQAYEEYMALSNHLKRKKELLETLNSNHREVLASLTKLEASNEGKELRLSILRSKNESLDRDLNFALDQP